MAHRPEPLVVQLAAQAGKVRQAASVETVELSPLIL
jgi:hypothetical protein